MSKRVSIDDELISFCQNESDRRAARNLFDTLKRVRARQNPQWFEPAIKNIRSIKHVALCWLYAAGVGPARGSGRYSAVTKPFDVMAAYDSGVPLDRKLRSVFSQPLTHEAPIIPPRNAPSAVNGTLSRLVGLYSPEESPIRYSHAYLPSDKVSRGNIEEFLIGKGLLTKRQASLDYHVINAAVAYMKGDPQGLERVVGVLTQSSGLFGANDGETLTLDVQKKTLRSWMSSLLFHRGVDYFIVDAFRQLQHGDGKRNAITMPRLHQSLKEQDYHDTSDSRPKGELTALAKSYIFENIILPAIPTLQMHPLSQTPLVGTLEWGYLHIGLSFAINADLDWQVLSHDELSALGMMLETALRSGLMKYAHIKSVILPALLYYVLSHDSTGQKVKYEELFGNREINRSILINYYTACDKLESQRNPETYFFEVMSNYLNRTKLAEEVIRLDCATESIPLAGTIERYKDNHANSRCSDFVGIRSGVNASLPDLNLLFHQQNAEIADAFLLFDKRRILLAFSYLLTDERVFLQEAKITKAKVTFSHRLKPQTVWGYMGRPHYNALMMAENTDLFIVESAYRDAIYALVGHDDAYQFRRIEQNISSLWDLTRTASLKLKHDADIHCAIVAENSKILKAPHDDIDFFAERIGAVHRQRLLTRLNESGYDATLQEQIKDFLLSLIPLHDCISQVIKKNQQAAVMACSADALALIPIMGHGAKLAGRMAFNVGFGARIALRPLLAGTSIRHFLKTHAKIGILRLAEHAFIPASQELNRQFMAQLGVDFLRLFDPGIELTGRIGYSTLKQTSEAALKVGNDLPILNKIALMLRQKLAVSQALSTTHIFCMAHHPVLGRKVPVVRLSGDRFRGKDIYVRVDPESGDPFGLKYTLSADRILQRIPTRMALRLRNLLDQGLGGLGAVTSGRRWQTNGVIAAAEGRETYMDVQLYQHDPATNAVHHENSPADQADSYDQFWRRMYEREKYKPVQFHIRTHGITESEAILFPELGVPLWQESIDATEYERAIALLSPQEKRAVRTWTLIESDGKSYSDGTPNLTKQFQAPINVEINEKLRNGIPFNYEEQQVFTGLISFLSKNIPRQGGSYLRVAEYLDYDAIPWRNRIAVGDIVTNYPQFMSVSADSQFARLFVEQAAEDGPWQANAMAAVILYRFDNAQKCTPLLPMAASTVIHEVEYLYPPASFFRVKGISIATGISEFLHPKIRIGVILEEIEGIPLAAKNLFTGALKQYRLPSLYSTAVHPA
ncbi:hypothetical protein [Martelella alba]|uniref:Uncharacterized protein n=1 Tax=Martelella alba TaxID=2590451 RepID=A0ABY2SLB1_9HYPH|nr:hypothetical protein [Martelella alba]TKI06291.1 hypothetical protein FCN80_10645 [Martelella alba]